MGVQHIVKVHMAPLWDRYLRERSWECEKSPTGAHHWLGEESDPSLFRCKHCGKDRKAVGLKKRGLGVMVEATSKKEG